MNFPKEENLVMSPKVVVKMRKVYKDIKDRLIWTPVQKIQYVLKNTCLFYYTYSISKAKNIY